MNKFKKYKSLRGPPYLEIYTYSFFGLTTTIFKYIYLYNIFDERLYVWTPSFFFLFFFSLKLIHFHRIKSLMKRDTFDSTKLQHTPRQSKPITTISITSTHIYRLLYFFPYLLLVFKPSLPTFIPFSPLFYLFPQMLKCRRTKKKCLVWRNSWIKNEISLLNSL